MANLNKDKSPSDLLVHTLELFGEDEPTNVAIVWETNGTVQMARTGDDPVHTMGMLAVGSHMMTMHMNPAYISNNGEDD